MSRLKNVAVIGAGPGGLCTARHLLSNPNHAVSVKPVVFEQNDVVGGTWVYEDIDKDNKEVFSSIYKNLKTNLPKQTMCFPDFPFPDNVPSYMHHTTVRKYTEDYADHYRLKDLIRFNTKVVNVSPILGANDNGSNGLNERFVRWNVKSTDKHTNETVDEEYDDVVVCNGHYSVPAYPSIAGLDNFTGKTVHSHYYRDPTKYSGKTALVLGVGPSGTDIMAELSECSDNVYLSHRGEKLVTWLPPNVKEVPNISHVNENGHFVFEDSSSAAIDVYFPCTGYRLHFPFLAPESGIVIEDNTILDLYKHIFSIKYPSLSFVGLTWQNSPLPAFHQQCQYIMKVITETIDLPSSEEMSDDTERERKERSDLGELKKYFHRMGDRQWAYNREIAALAKNEENPPIIEKLYTFAWAFRSKNVCTYKNMEYKALNDSEFENVTKEAA